MDKLEQLKFFATWEKENNPSEYRHIAEWAVEEIERLREVTRLALEAMKSPCDCGSQCPQCELFWEAVTALEAGEGLF